MNKFKSLAFEFVYPFAFTVQLFGLLAVTVKNVWSSRNKGKELVFGEVIKQVYFTGAQAFWLITFFAAALGFGFGYEISVLLSSVGNPALVNKVFYDIVIRELAPLATAIIVMGRSGSAVAVELGTLVCNEEINAYKSLGINIYRFLIYPRMLGISFATVVLSVYFVIVTIVSGALLVYFQAGVPFQIYMSRITAEGRVADLIIFLIKNTGNGMLMTLICCISGLSIKPSLTEIPRAVSRAMVHCMFALIVFSGTMALFTYF